MGKTCEPKAFSFQCMTKFTTNKKKNKKTKNNRMMSVHFQGKPFNITVIQVYAPTSNGEDLKLNGSMKTYKTF